jgi:hypothetical protein
MTGILAGVAAGFDDVDHDGSRYCTTCSANERDGHVDDCMKRPLLDEIERLRALVERDSEGAPLGLYRGDIDGVPPLTVIAVGDMKVQDVGDREVIHRGPTVVLAGASVDVAAWAGAKLLYEKVRPTVVIDGRGAPAPVVRP